MDILTDLSHHINTILACTLTEYTNALDGTDLRGSQLSYLLTVCRLPGMTQDTLARHLGVDKSNVARQLADLEQKGYVSRRREQNDKRAIIVEPTDRAYELLPRLIEMINDCQSALTRGMSAEECELLTELVARMARNASRLAARRHAHFPGDAD